MHHGNLTFEALSWPAHSNEAVCKDAVSQQPRPAGLRRQMLIFTCDVCQIQVIVVVAVPLLFARRSTCIPSHLNSG